MPVPVKRPRAKEKRNLCHVKSPVKIHTVETVEKGSPPIGGLVTDIDKLEMGLFTYAKIPRSTPVLIEMSGKLAGKLQCKVVSCKMLPLTTHVLKSEENPPLWRIRVRAIVGGQDEAEFPQELVNALLNFGGE